MGTEILDGHVVQTPQPVWARPYGRATWRAVLLQIALGLVLAAHLAGVWVYVMVDLITASAHGRLVGDQLSLIHVIAVVTGIVLITASVTSLVAFSIWMHRAYRNLPALGAGGLRYSPRRAAASWFIPFLNLARPYTVMREIWQFSAPDDRGWRLLKLWWAAYLVGNVAGGYALRLNLPGWPGLALVATSLGIGALAAALAILAIRRIQSWQQQRSATMSDRPADSPDAAVTSAPGKTPPRLRGALALTLILLAVCGSTAIVYTQSTHPGGLTQWYADLSGPPPLSDLEVQTAIRRALVTVKAKTWRSNDASEGSAFFLGDATTLVTAAHVIPDPVVSLTVIDGSGHEWPAELRGLSRDLDLAMLQVSGMSPRPLQAATHAVNSRERVFLAGNPQGEAPGTVVSGVIQSANFHSQTDTTTLDHAYRILGGPVGAGMSGGPVVDSWGRVIGVISAATQDGLRSVAVPIKEFLYQRSSSNWPLTQPLYVGTPLISGNASDLVLPASSIGHAATQDRNTVDFTQGSVAGRDLDSGSLWVYLFPTIKEASDDLAKAKADFQTKLPRATVQSVSVGDGGTMLVYNSGTGLHSMAVLWTERNAEAIWWIQTIGRDESKFFNDVTEQQEKRLADAP